jgi:hypothetical protein
MRFALLLQFSAQTYTADQDIYTLYDIFDKTGIEYYIFERKKDSLHQMEVKSCQKVDLLRPFVEISRRFIRTSHAPSTCYA